MVELVAVVCLVHQGWGAGFGLKPDLLAGLQADGLVEESADGQAGELVGKSGEFVVVIVVAVVVAVVVGSLPQW